MASNTNKLKLYVYNTSTDGSLYFNIQEALTNNFVKIDNYATEVDNKLTNTLTTSSIASSTVLGGIKVGENLTISPDGTLSATGGSSDIDEEQVKQIIEEYLSTISGKNPGEIITSLDPISDPNLLLLDGRSIALNGIYSDFITKYIQPLQISNPERFITNTQYEDYIQKYDCCGFYVYDEDNNSLRLPKLSGMVQYTVISTDSGNIVEAGLPNILVSTTGAHTHTTSSSGSHTHNYTTVDTTNTPRGDDRNGCFSYTQESQTSSSGSHTHTINSSGNHTHTLSSTFIGKSNTVQPQTMKLYAYIVVGNRVNTNVTTTSIVNAINEINNLSTKLNSIVGIAEDSNAEEDSDQGYIVFDDNMCIQWGKISGSSNTITFQKPFLNNKYCFIINPIGSSYTYTETDKQASYIQFSRGSSNPTCYWVAFGIAEYADYAG